MSKVLITGATGFIGLHVAQALTARGHDVTCLVRPASRVDQLRPLGVRLAHGDVTDPGSLRAALAGVEVVYHVAGCTRTLRPAEFYLVNAEGMWNMGCACAAQTTPPVLIVVSSLAAAGPAPNGRARTEADRPVQVSHYGRSKRRGELALERLAARVPITVVRPPIVFGEADRMSLPMFSAIARLGVHMVPGLARHRYSVIHAADLANLLILAAERGRRLRPPGAQDAAAPAGYYFAACEEHPTYADLGRMIGAAVGRRRVLLLHTPTSFVWLAATAVEAFSQVRRQTAYLNLDKAREITAGSWLCSPQAAVEELGFQVAAPLSARLRQTADWFRREGWM